ncbi:MAG: hypothetical protein MR018_00400 [Clostridiales bacterium]|nr:hypothetical protein [Clostridiales bacterium]MDY5347504.1 hypothetical protein [Eubacteriales bacterium]
MKHEQQDPFNNSRTPSQPGDQSARLLFCPVFCFAKQNGKRGKFVCLRPLNPMYVDRIGFSLYPHSFLIQSRGSIAVEIAVPARYNKIRTFFLSAQGKSMQGMSVFVVYIGERPLRKKKGGRHERP